MSLKEDFIILFVPPNSESCEGSPFVSAKLSVGKDDKMMLVMSAPFIPGSVRCLNPIPTHPNLLIVSWFSVRVNSMF